MFADDTAIWKTGSSVNEVKKRVQKALKYIKKWCGLWGFKVSIAKTSVVLFSRRVVKGKVELKYEGKVLKTEKKVRFLGMIFDSRLSWKDHIDYVIDKCNKRINLLKVLTGSRWGADKETMLLVYRGLIRSCMEYGCAVYDLTCKMHKRRSDRVQAQCLRICSGALWCTSVAALQVDCGEMPLDLRRNIA